MKRSLLCCLLSLLCCLLLVVGCDNDGSSVAAKISFRALLSEDGTTITFVVPLKDDAPEITQMKVSWVTANMAEDPETQDQLIWGPNQVPPTTSGFGEATATVMVPTGFTDFRVWLEPRGMLCEGYYCRANKKGNYGYEGHISVDDRGITPSVDAGTPQRP